MCEKVALAVERLALILICSTESRSIRFRACAVRQRLQNYQKLPEFPGGKVRDGEPPELCLAREMKEEFDIYGVDFRQRGKITDEMIEVLHKLWCGEMVEHHGQHFDFPRVQLSPAPQVHPPIYVGGSSEIALRRAARVGDGYIGAGTAPDEVGALLAQLDELRKEYQRDHLPFEAMLGISAAPSLDLYRRLADDGLQSTVAPPFQYALGKKHSTIDEKKRFMEMYAEGIVRHF